MSNEMYKRLAASEEQLIFCASELESYARAILSLAKDLESMAEEITGAEDDYQEAIREDWNKTIYEGQRFANRRRYDAAVAIKEAVTMGAVNMTEEW